MSNSRIPQTQPEFDAYITGVNNYLNAIRPGDPNPRGIMLGLTAQELTDLSGSTWFGKWRTGNPLNPGLWEIHENIFGPTSNDKNDKDVKDFMRDFGPFFRPMLNTMAVSKILDNGDRLVLRIKERDDEPTFHEVPDDRGVHGDVHKVLSLQHNIRLLDPENPDTKEQPEGVKATRVYRAIKDQGVPPAAADYVLIGDTSSFEYLSKFSSDQIGKRAHYHGVWIDSKRNEGVPGNDFSETII